MAIWAGHRGSSLETHPQAACASSACRSRFISLPTASRHVRSWSSTAPGSATVGVRHDFMVREFSLHAADRVSNGGHRLSWLPEARKSVLQLDRTAEVFSSLDEGAGGGG